MVYIISSRGYEEYNPVLVEGPEVDDWRSFCSSLMDEVVQTAIKKGDRFVCWEEIIQALKDILCTKGYQVLFPEEFEFFDYGPIEEQYQSDYSDYPWIKPVIEHNDQLEQKIEEEIKNRGEK